MSIDLNKNAANFTEKDKWFLTNLISAMFSLEEPGRLGIKLYLDNAHARAKYKLYKNPEIVTLEHLYHRLLDTAHDIETLFLTIPIEDIRKRLDGKYMERVEERCIKANGNIEMFIKLGIDDKEDCNRPFD